MAKLYKIETYLLDYNNDFRDSEILKNYLDYRMNYGFLNHIKIDVADIGEWDDDHPLNIVDCPEEEYEKYFKENKQ